MDSKSSIGVRIAELRKQYNYSQEYVAEKLNVSRQAVSKWEQDLSAPDTNNLIALAVLFDVSVEYLAIGKKPVEEKREENPASQPSKSGFGVQKIVGFIFLGAGLLALVLGILLSVLLVLLSVYLLIVGILCLCVRKHIGLTLAWVLLLVSGLLLFCTTGINLAGSLAINMAILVSLIFVGLTAALIVCTVVAAVQRNKRKNG
jgi:transcriptional regulator with XRE-family HTH domain